MAFINMPAPGQESVASGNGGVNMAQITSQQNAYSQSVGDGAEKPILTRLSVVGPTLEIFNLSWIDMGFGKIEEALQYIENSTGPRALNVIKFFASPTQSFMAFLKLFGESKQPGDFFFSDFDQSADKAMQPESGADSSDDNTYKDILSAANINLQGMHPVMNTNHNNEYTQPSRAHHTQDFHGFNSGNDYHAGLNKPYFPGYDSESQHERSKNKSSKFV